MFKPALRIFTRLLPFTGAMMASVAIGASTPAPQRPSVPSRETQPQETLRGDARGRMTLYGGSAFGQGLDRSQSIDIALIARADPIAAPTALYPDAWLDSALIAPVTISATRNEGWTSLHLPRPDRWTALMATLGLVAFFFLRRIV